MVSIWPSSFNFMHSFNNHYNLLDFTKIYDENSLFQGETEKIATHILINVTRQSKITAFRCR